MSKFNEEQKRVINELKNNILLLAPAGTGKTNTLSHRILNILENYNGKILCLTFTNRACKEMKERIGALDAKNLNNVEIYTFHSFCFHIIKDEKDEEFFDSFIYDEDECVEIIEDILPEELKEYSKVAKNFISKIKLDIDINEEESLKNLIESKEIYNLARERGKLIVDLCRFYIDNGIELYKRYNQTLRENHALDFDDLMVKVCNIFKDEEKVKKWRSKYKYINIDEVQDTSLLEYSIISKIIKGNNSLLCGDPIQTIYEWRGAKGEEILELYEKEFNPEIIRFNKNYRSTKNLTVFATKFLEKAFNIKAVDYSIAEAEEVGEKISGKSFKNTYDECEWIYNEIVNLGDIDFTKIAILTRNNNVNIELSECFRKIRRSKDKKLDFLLTEEFKFFRRKEIKDVLAFIKVCANPFDSNSLKRILLNYEEGIGQRTLESITGLQYEGLGISLVDFINPNTLKYGDPYMPLINSLENEEVVVLDVESTGVDVTEDEVVQIAAIKVNSLGKVVDKFEKFIKPTKELGSSVYVHGFTKEFLEENGEDGVKVFKELLTFIGSGVIVGHNVGYDVSIIDSNMKRLNMEGLGYINYYDTLEMSRKFYPSLKNHKLEYLSKYFNVENESTHNAMDDILATKDILMSIIRKNITPNLRGRVDVYGMYEGKFSSAVEKFEILKEKSHSLTLKELTEYILKEWRILDKYSKEEDRIENIKEFIDIVENIEEKEKSHRDNIQLLLNFSSLSNSELDRYIEKYNKIPIITVHQSKGLEFDYVFLPCLIENTFPSYAAIKENNLEEEKRVFYVAITRAKKKLYLSYHKYDGKRDKQGSRFLKMIDKNLLC